MISIIAAVAKNRAIGFQNKLIYWLPNDLKRFKALTTGHTIIMGRNTFALQGAHHWAYDHHGAQHLPVTAEGCPTQPS